ncbi:transcriptional regulator [Haloarchaeobius salinus]|uniref:transcriptional regulator n=1 Tax=Haloarchaeobius salinus TaxID=1198298 RepID=UPI002108D3AE|nr:transcriptional regulator [Haloarchaeobius salinus]
MTEQETALQQLARDFATVIPAVDREAEHDRWDPGIGPFEEERQLEMILDELAEDGTRPEHIETEEQYPDSRKRCDLVITEDGFRMPVEAKLLRFRRDNGNIDPNMYKSVFSPFPERSSSSLLTDSRKLYESDFGLPAGLLGLYYEKNGEEYEQLTADRIAEKFQQDVSFWYDIGIETVAIERFEGLRHQHFGHGAVIGWLLPHN